MAGAEGTPHRRWLVAIVLLGAALRLIAFRGYTGSDDGVYARLAHDVSVGTFTLLGRSVDPVFPLRMGVIAPTALAFRLAGPTEAALVAYPWLLSVAGILLAFSVTRAFANERAGIAAAALTACVPLDVLSATQLYPDLPSAFWAGCGVLALWSGRGRSSPLAGVALGAASGLALGASWLCKETLVYLLPFLVWLSVREVRRSRRSGFAVGAAALALLAVVTTEALAYALATGDPLFRLHAVERNYEVARQWFFAPGSPLGWTEGGYWPALWLRLLVRGPAEIFLSPTLGFLPLIAVTAVAARGGARGPETTPAVWLGSLLVLFNFGSSSLLAYRPLVLFDRYLYLLVLPSAIVIAVTLEPLFSRPLARPRLGIRSRGGLWLAAALLVGLAGLLGPLSRGPESQVERRLARRLPADARLLTDSRTASVLEFFWGYPRSPATRDFAGLSAADAPLDSLVLVNRQRGEFLHEAYDYCLPEFFARVPPQWTLEWQHRSGSLYRVRERSPLADPGSRPANGAGR